TLYDQFGKDFLYTDSLKAYTWIKEAIFYNNVLDDVTEADITSAFGRLWKPSVQKVDATFKRMSNGRIYEVTNLKIPNNIHSDMINLLFYYCIYVQDVEKYALFKLNIITTIEAKDEYKVTIPTIWVELQYLSLRVKGDLKDGKPASVEYTPIMLEPKE